MKHILMKSYKALQPRLKIEPITIKEPYKPDIKEFADTEEFTRYFRGNEELFKEMSDDMEKPARFLTANKLNRTYKIPGYRIRIIRKGTDNEELTLVKDYSGKSTTINEEPINSTTIDVAMERIDEMQRQIDCLTEQINNIESFLCQLKR